MTDPLNSLRHELANPLTALLNEAQLALMNEAMDEDSRVSFQHIERLALRLRSILRDR